MRVQAYEFHGVRLHVDSEDPAIAAAIDDRLRHFRVQTAGDPDVRFELRSVPDGAEHRIERPRGQGRPVYDPPAGEVFYFPAEDAFWIDYEDRVRVLATRAGLVVSVREAELGSVWLLSRPLFTLPLVESLKRRGLFMVHAGAVASGGKAVLLPGASGSGKSTLAVALAHAGMPFMADDTVFLAQHGDRVRVHAFPDETDVSDQTAGWFPALRGLVGRLPPGWPKHRVRLDELLGAQVALEADPGVLVFPSISAGATSELEPLGQEQALVELVPNILLTDPSASQAHLDALACLVESAPAYRLAVGRDFDRAAELVTSVVPS